MISHVSEVFLLIVCYLEKGTYDVMLRNSDFDIWVCRVIKKNEYMKNVPFKLCRIPTRFVLRKPFCSFMYIYARIHRKYLITRQNFVQKKGWVIRVF